MSLENLEKRRNQLISNSLYEFCKTEDPYDDCLKVKNVGIFQSERTGYEYSIFFRNEEDQKFSLECNQSSGVIGCRLFTRSEIITAGFSCDGMNNIQPSMLVEDTGVWLEDSTYQDSSFQNEDTTEDSSDADVGMFDVLADAVTDALTDIFDSENTDKDSNGNPLDADSSTTDVQADTSDAYNWLPGNCKVGETDEIEFEDENLKACVASHVGSTYITPQECNITSLNCSGKNIASLAGLECCTSLNSLKLDSNSIEDLTPLAGLFGLANIWLDNNFITDIQPLSGLEQLKKLGLSHNNISVIPELLDLPALQSLDMSYNYISDISPLASLVNLSSLDLSSNDIFDATPLCDNAGISLCDYVNLTANPVLAKDLTCLNDKGVDAYLDCGSIYGAGCTTQPFPPKADAPINFGITTIGCYSNTYLSCLKNVGTVPLNVISASISSDCGPEFLALNTPTSPQLLESNESLCVEVAYLPKNEGSDDCSLQWETGANNLCSYNPADSLITSVPLIGEGTWDTETTEYFTVNANDDLQFILQNSADASPGNIRIWIDRGMGYEACTGGWDYGSYSHTIFFDPNFAGTCATPKQGDKVKIWYKFACESDAGIF